MTVIIYIQVQQMIVFQRTELTFKIYFILLLTQVLTVIAVEEFRNGGCGLLDLIRLPHPSNSEPREGLEVQEGGRMGGQEIRQQGRSAFPGRKDQNF